MSFNEYARNKNARKTAPLAAPSAFEDHGSDHSTHFMPGDSSKIFNPRTGKYVKIDGKVGQEIIAEYGYPREQMGGNSFDDISQQLSKSFSDLYENLASTWKQLTSSQAPKQAPKSIPKKAVKSQYKKR
jgi:hypothetical protein